MKGVKNMDSLNIINKKGILYANSIEVAKMINKRHADLLKDIRKYCEYLNEGNFPLVEFFKERNQKPVKE